MFRKMLFGLALLLFCSVSVAPAQAQRQRGGSGFSMQEQDHKAEIGIIGGYVWTTAKEFYYGVGNVNADIEDSGFYGVEADVNVRPGMQLVLLWTRQDTAFKLKGLGVPADMPTSMDVAVEYWQIGAIQGVQKGNVMPYGKFTLGGTRYAADTPFGSQDEWQFSMIFGIGAKMYANEKLALRFEATLPFTITNGGVSAGFSTGSGAGLYVGGTGIAQWTVALGANVLLGSK